MSLLEAHDLKKDFFQGSHKVTALDGISLHLTEGEFLCVSGRSGSGKSTLLLCLATLLAPSGGEILFRQKDIQNSSESQRARFRNKEIGFVFQDPHLLSHLTVLENVILPLRYAGVSWKERIGRGKELLQFLHLDHLEKRIARTLSGGEAQRVAIARGLINAPSILLADEPTGNLDSQTAQELMHFLKTLHSSLKMTLLVATHDPVFLKAADRVMTLSDGTVVEELCLKPQETSSETPSDTLLEEKSPGEEQAAQPEELNRVGEKE